MRDFPILRRGKKKKKNQLLCKTDTFLDEPISNDIPEKIKDIINKVATSNPELGTLPSDGFRISLKDETPVFSKPYSIAYNLQDSVKQEIEKLLQLKVIRKSRSLYASPAWPILNKKWQS
ncbi:Retrovirus-related Pol polyprotein from transposon opus [Nosema granulosis]|uniref:Retrovirus-related Pol polyprotein from transposon opus n=1 Tax=Nosema granulosis TaxID=83296 RepID=A0A9P6GVN5_9MICR|nr:Retrovirus-related Pol polyprotein from transposon opus [Nosema granulosis]